MQGQPLYCFKFYDEDDGRSFQHCISELQAQQRQAESEARRRAGEQEAKPLASPTAAKAAIQAGPTSRLVHWNPAYTAPAAAHVHGYACWPTPTARHSPASCRPPARPLGQAASEGALSVAAGIRDGPCLQRIRGPNRWPVERGGAAASGRRSRGGRGCSRRLAAVTERGSAPQAASQLQ